LFLVRPSSSGLRATTHEKYLINPQLAGQFGLVGHDFQIESLKEKAFITHYEGRPTLEKMKSAVSYFAGPKKRGCHQIAVNNPEVIDCEIAFPGEGSAPRVDLATIEEDARLVFWEAKHYKNGDLRALGEHVPVYQQVETYREYLAEHRDDVRRSYTGVAENLIALAEMGWERKLSPLITKIANGERQLTLGKEPKVGLIIFGFDKGQRDDPGWRKHLARLHDEIKFVHAVGRPGKIPFSRIQPPAILALKTR
jgi:hypothetical protein